MQMYKRAYLPLGILSIGYIFLGIFQLAFPESAKAITSYIMAAIAIVYGILRIALYFIKTSDAENVLQNDLAIGIVLIVLGMYLIVHPMVAADIVSVLLGFSILFDSVIKLQNCFFLQRNGYTYWWIALIASGVTLLLGLLLIAGAFQGNGLPYFLGIVLIINGIVNIAAILLLIWHKRHLEKMAGQPAPIIIDAPAEPPHADAGTAHAATPAPQAEQTPPPANP